MRELENIGSESFQRHTIIFQESEIILKLRFLPVVEQWFIDVNYKDFSANGIKLAVGVLHIRSSNQPFDFLVQDNSGNGLDPFRLDDFSTERCTLFIAEADDMAELRGTEVAL